MTTPENKITRKGRLFIVSAPSGAGKTTLCRMLMDEIDTLQYSVSHTTRSPREGEQNGVDYYFVSNDEFERLITENGLIEWAEVHGNYYGTSVQAVADGLKNGQDILLDIDVQGARQIVGRYPESVTIFIMPPSMEELRKRLESRGTDSTDTIEKRIRNAEAEIQERGFYRHIIVNDDIRVAGKELADVFKHYKR